MHLEVGTARRVRVEFPGTLTSYSGGKSTPACLRVFHMTCPDLLLPGSFFERFALLSFLGVVARFRFAPPAPGDLLLRRAASGLSLSLSSLSLSELLDCKCVVQRASQRVLGGQVGQVLQRLSPSGQALTSSLSSSSSSSSSGSGSGFFLAGVDRPFAAGLAAAGLGAGLVDLGVALALAGAATAARFTSGTSSSESDIFVTVYWIAVCGQHK